MSDVEIIFLARVDEQGELSFRGLLPESESVMSDAEIIFLARVDEQGELSCAGQGSKLETEEQAVELLKGTIQFIGSNVELSPASFQMALMSAMYADADNENQTQLEVDGEAEEQPWDEERTN